MTGRIVLFGPSFWVPVFDPPFSLVGRFLTQDVQRCVASCEYYLAAALGVASGRDQPIEIQGNGNVVRFVPDGVTIWSIHDDQAEPASLSMDAFVSVLAYWKSIVASWDRLSPPSDLPAFSYSDPGS
jgi:hypothetical protein